MKKNSLEESFKSMNKLSSMLSQMDGISNMLNSIDALSLSIQNMDGMNAAIRNFSQISESTKAIAGISDTLNRMALDAWTVTPAYEKMIETGKLMQDIVSNQALSLQAINFANLGIAVSNMGSILETSRLIADMADRNIIDAARVMQPFAFQTKALQDSIVAAQAAIANHRGTFNIEDIHFDVLEELIEDEEEINEEEQGIRLENLSEEDRQTLTRHTEQVFTYIFGDDADSLPIAEGINLAISYIKSMNIGEKIKFFLIEILKGIIVALILTKIPATSAQQIMQNNTTTVVNNMVINNEHTVTNTQIINIEVSTDNQQGSIEVRQEPNLESPAIYSLGCDTTYKIVEAHEEWIQIEFLYADEYIRGWIISESIQVKQS